MKKVKHLIISAMLLGASASAMASDQFLGTLPAGYTGFTSTTSIGSFLDKVYFSLGGESSGSFGVGALNFTVKKAPILNISDLSMTLFNSSNVQLGNGLDFTVNSLAAGDYHLDVAGNTTGIFGGVYAGGIDVSPVPEPGVWSLLLAGFSMIGFMAYRRREM